MNTFDLALSVLCLIGILNWVLLWLVEGIFWFHLRPKIRNRTLWTGIWALKRKSELKELESYGDIAILKKVKVVRRLEQIQNVLLIVFIPVLLLVLYLDPNI